MNSGKRARNESQYDDDLFSAAQGSTRGPKEPLAERMRPRSFDGFVGQEHIVGEGRLLRRAIEADQLTSILLWGPAGTGKTTIANIIAHETNAEFATLNAVLDGVKDLRDVIDAAERRPKNVRTVLFIDEIHRWNKAQQEGLLPHIEAAPTTLCGATTAKPVFSLVQPLIRRLLVFRLEPLQKSDVPAAFVQALVGKDNQVVAGSNVDPVALA